MNQQKSAVSFYYPRLFILSLAGLAAIVSAVFWLRAPAPVKAQSEDELAPSIVVFSENFDNVTAPALPAGWTTARTGEIDTFATVTNFPDSLPNAAFVHDPNTQGIAELVTPAIALGNVPHKVIFRHFYQTDFEFDGGVLELSINGGGFTDIVTAGGSFITGGYDTPLVGSSLAGRRAWTGQQAGYITTEVNLPASTNNQSIRLRWRIATDPMEAGTGWWIDSVQVTNAISGINVNAISVPNVGTASPYPSEIEVTNHEGLVSGVQVNLVNFSHASPDDVDLLLVAPSGRKVVLMSDVGGGNALTNANLFFSDAATASLPDSTAIASGTYKPTNFEPNDAFPAPAPGGAPSGTRLSALNGTTANGVWRLFLVDDNGNNAGNVTGGWQLFVQSSPDAIGIPEIGAAQPYASQKQISGFQGTITKATVTLSNFSHTAPDDADVMLVAPNGRRIILMSDVGGSTEVGGLNLTFDDAAAAGLPDNAALASGTFKPTDFEPGDAFPAPAPQGAPSGTTLDVFYGGAPNGTWRLFVVDDNGENAGSIAGDWNVTLQTSMTACAFTLSPVAQAFPITGGSGSFNINMPLGCSWAASTNSSFITITSNASGDGRGSLSFSVAQNMSGGRAGTIDVSNGAVTRSFQVQQPSGCPFSLSQEALNFGASGGSGNVAVTAGNICTWQATTSANWIQITSAQQSGNGSVTFNVQPNATGSIRNATVTLGARTFTVTQASAASGRQFDFDGDGKADASVFRPGDGTWYLNRSSQGFTAVQFGISTDRLAPADYDGDGKTDFGVFRDGNWYLLRSTAGFTAVQFGSSGDAPQPADFDGDGKAELAVFRASAGSWFVLNLANNQFNAFQFGANGDKPVVADYDGDGKADYAVYRPTDGTWYMLRSQQGFTGVQFGISSDKPVAGDYDGDGRADQAVYRPADGTWYLLRSQQGFTAVQFGIQTDSPAPADYDGDGKTDIAVFRAGNWYLQQSTQGFNGFQFGAAGDKPVPNAFVP